LGFVYRAALPADVKGFDPAQTDDQYSVIAVKQVYETLLHYHYLKRPIELAPLLADSMPQTSDDGLEYIFRIKKGVRFQDDPCFKGEPRFLSAYDFVFSIKRLADIKVKSSGWWIFDGRIKGLDEFRKTSTESDVTSYDLPVEGLFAIDSHTLCVKLNAPFPQLPYLFAMQFTSAVPHEAVSYYGEEFLNHPVGTGPFIITEWRRRMRIKFIRNPFFREEFYPAEGEASDLSNGLLEDAGKKIPFIDTLILNIFNESEPMWLTFQRMGLEQAWIPKDNFDKAIGPDFTLNPDLSKQGIVLGINPSLDVTYTCFNMEDSLLGNNIHLRRAISFAWNTKKTIELLYNNRAIPSHSPIPPGLFGYEADFVNPYQSYDTIAAKLEMEKAGFPNGEGLPVLRYLETDNTLSRQWSDKFTQEMAIIGIKIKVDAVTWPEFLKRFRNKKYQIAGTAWGADYPDPENFLQLLYGPNEAPGTNNANYKSSEYDSLYVLLATVKNNTQKLDIIRRMKIIIANDAPWIPGTHRLSVGLRYNWIKNYKYNDIASGEYRYIKIDTALRNSRIRESWK
jgi:ABC-type oligopeptide transport system substrate-binding subunit